MLLFSFNFSVDKNIFQIQQIKKTSFTQLSTYESRLNLQHLWANCKCNEKQM